MRRLVVLNLIVTLLLFSAASPRSGMARETVTVFAAASLKSALDDIVAAYQPYGPIVVSYGGSSALARQIQYGAPAQVFISANPDWMDVLEQDGLLAAQSRVPLLTNRLVLIASAENDARLTLQKGADLIGLLGDDRLAMALVDAVPAGQYGQMALKSLGLWDSVKNQIAQTDNVRAALRLVALGETPFGIVYATDAVLDPGVRVVAEFPGQSHAPITYPAAILKDPFSTEAKMFFDYLTGPDAWQVFKAHGFGPPLVDQ